MCIRVVLNLKLWRGCLFGALELCEKIWPVRRSTLKHDIIMVTGPSRSVHSMTFSWAVCMEACIYRLYSTYTQVAHLVSGGRDSDMWTRCHLDITSVWLMIIRDNSCFSCDLSGYLQVNDTSILIKHCIIITTDSSDLHPKWVILPTNETHKGLLQIRL